MKKFLFMILSGLCAMPVYAQIGFGDYWMDCKSNDQKSVEVFIGDDAITSSGSQRKKMRRQGMVGMLWDVDFFNSNKKNLNRKIVWAKPMKLSDTSYRMAFPGHKPFVFRHLPFEMNKPSVRIDMEGGGFLECYVNLEMLNKGW
ncbi:MAG: hypothetical protein Q4A28_04410 [Brachymonas sp.]|nr:hypothetical protein [Brachymonas sp.]